MIFRDRVFCCGGLGFRLVFQGWCGIFSEFRFLISTRFFGAGFLVFGIVVICGLGTGLWDKGLSQDFCQFYFSIDDGFVFQGFFRRERLEICSSVFCVGIALRRILVRGQCQYDVRFFWGAKVIGVASVIGLCCGQFVRNLVFFEGSFRKGSCQI